MENVIQNQVTGGIFLISETKPEDIFTPEDFSEEQLMMKEAVIGTYVS